MTLADRIPDLARAPVSAAMARPAVTMSQRLTLHEALARLATGYPGCPVTDDRGVLVGYCGVEDLSGALAHHTTSDARVSDLMRRDAPALAEDRSVAEATMLLRRRDDVLAITTADGTGKAVGTLTRLDVLRWALSRIRQEEPRQDTAVHGCATA